MPQHDYVIDNAAGAVVRADLNSALLAIVSFNAGTGAPSPTYANMPWIDTAAGQFKIRNSANTAWVIQASWDGSTWIPYRSGAALGDAATRTAGTGADNLVPLDGNGRWPAVDMRNLTSEMLKLEQVTSAAHTLTEANMGRMVEFTNSGAKTVTLPEDSTENLPVGFFILAVQRSTTAITFVAQGSDTISSLNNNTQSGGEHAAVTVVKRASGSWALYGSLA